MAALAVIFRWIRLSAGIARYGEVFHSPDIDADDG